MASALRYCMEVAIDFIAWLERHPFSTCHHVPWCSLIALREVNYFWQQVGGALFSGKCVTNSCF